MALSDGALTLPVMFAANAESPAWLQYVQPTPCVASEVKTRTSMWSMTYSMPQDMYTTKSRGSMTKIMALLFSSALEMRMVVALLGALCLPPPLRPCRLVRDRKLAWLGVNADGKWPPRLLLRR